MELESDDSDYVTPPPDNNLPDPVPRGPVAHSQNQSQKVTQDLTGEVTRVLSYMPKWPKNKVLLLVGSHEVT